MYRELCENIHREPRHGSGILFRVSSKYQSTGNARGREIFYIFAVHTRTRKYYFENYNITDFSTELGTRALPPRKLNTQTGGFIQDFFWGGIAYMTFHLYYTYTVILEINAWLK